MSDYLTEVEWLDAQRQVTLRVLAESSGLSDQELKLLTDYGVLQCVGAQAGEPLYRADCISVARTAFRLRHDLDLGLEGLALVLDLLQRMRGLEAELDDLRARFPGGY